MSGIAGIFNLNGAAVDKNILEKMSGAIAHRGPDDAGYFLSHDIGLCHRRLAVIDLTESGRQPVTTGDGHLTLVHDGQIYNAPEIRRELAAKGYSFHSKADAEVILYSYREWGEECLNKFNGMWSFVIWDKDKRQLFCARDRIGEKPFYYYFDGEVFIFASEIKAILQHPRAPVKVNERTVYNYLMWGMIGYSEDTFFAGIKELGPSRYLQVNTPKGLYIKQWWDVKVNSSLNNLPRKDVEETASKLRLLLEDAIRLRLRSDVPLAMTLSGGLDSSSLAVLAGRMIKADRGIYPGLTGDRLKTFSACFENESVDERVFIDRVAETAGVETNYVFPKAKRIWEELPMLIRQQEKPAGIYSVSPRWQLMQAARAQGIKVVLGGDGSDVMLAGHHEDFGVYFLELALRGRFLRLISQSLKTTANLGLRDLSSHAGTVFAGFMLGHSPPSLQLGVRRALFSLRGRSTDRVLTPAFDSAHKKSGLSDISREYICHVPQLNYYLKDNLFQITNNLNYIDSLAAHFGIETRCPFLDYRLIEFIFSIPAGLKINDGWTKWILRQSMQGILPDDVRLRKYKNAFGVPLQTWLKANREQINELFGASALSSQFIDPAVIKNNLDRLLSRKKTCWEVWRYINLEMWLKAYF